jgi:low temperature requirement protein LtrA
MFVAMAAIMILALLMPDFFDDTRGASVAMVAAAAYVMVRLMHLALFYFAGRDDPGIMRAALRLGRSVVIAAILLIGGAYLGGDWQLVLVTIAVVIDIAGPLLSGGQGWRLALSHFAERHGLIVIIALGESIVAIGVGASGIPMSAALLTTAVLGVAVACTLWVAYFDGASDSLEEAVERREGVDQVTTARDIYSFMHFLLVAGLILMSLAMKSALKGAEKGWAEPLAGYASFALGLGLFQFLLGLWLMRKRAGATTSAAEAVVALVALLIIPLGTTLPVVATVVIVAALALVWRVVRAPAAQPV